MQTQSLSKAVYQLNQLSQEIDRQARQVHFSEQYEGQQIYRIRLAEFPQYLLGDLAKGFSVSYYTTLGKYIVFANDISLLRNLIRDVKYREVWGKSSINRGLLSQMPPEANLRLFLDINRFWNTLYQGLDEKWQGIFSQYETEFRHLGYLTAHLHHQNGRFHTSIFSQSTGTDAVGSRPEPAGNLPGYELDFPQPLYTAPYLVKNHNDNSQEVLVQDFSNDLYLISPDGKALWHRSAGAPILSDPVQIDIYHNDKLQYLFITTDRISLIDRLGRDVPGFPIFIPEAEHLQSLAVFALAKKTNTIL
ncbi:MAG: hypothetical protein HC880_09680 [Bacteroidia bacterium]|nr:hypothetical protein [Bacteroidia bacterium]